MALASALAFEARKLPVRAGGITVDHGLQDGSDTRAAEVAERMTALGLTPPRPSPSPSAAKEGPRPPPATRATPPSTPPPNATAPPRSS